MEQKKQEPIRDARQLGTAKMLILGLQHMFAMFGATILVPILVSGYFQKACGEPLTRGLEVFLYRLPYFVQALARLYFICVQSLRYRLFWVRHLLF